MTLPIRLPITRFIAVLVLLLLSAMAAPAEAQTLIAKQESDGSVTRVWLDGDRARIQGSSDAYLLVDTGYEQIHAVFPDSGDVMDLTADLPRLPPDGVTENTHATSLEHLGRGPQIAGYPTQRYRLRGNDPDCGEVFLSREALERADAADYLRVMGRFHQRQRLASRRSDRDRGACEAALQTAMDSYAENGLPLRVIDQAGNPRQEILFLQRRVSVEPDFFSLP